MKGYEKITLTVTLPPDIAAEAEAAKTKYRLASQAFDRADALVPTIARTYRVEIARRRIISLRKDNSSRSRKFDELAEKLGQKDLAPQSYRTLILRLIDHLDANKQTLSAILVVAKPYPRDLVLEIKWTELDLGRIRDMRADLVEELNGD